jgi:hypothetical protein
MRNDPYQNPRCGYGTDDQQLIVLDVTGEPLSHTPESSGYKGNRIFPQPQHMEALIFIQFGSRYRIFALFLNPDKFNDPADILLLGKVRPPLLYQKVLSTSICVGG